MRKLLSFSLLIFFISCSQPFDQFHFDKRVNRCFKNEGVALDVYKLDRSASKDDLLFHIQEKGIRNWEKNLEIIDSAKQMISLPEKEKLYIQKFEYYNETRLQLFQAMLKTVQENSEKYAVEIQRLDKEATKLAEDLKAINLY